MVQRTLDGGDLVEAMEGDSSKLRTKLNLGFNFKKMASGKKGERRACGWVWKVWDLIP